LQEELCILGRNILATSKDEEKRVRGTPVYGRREAF
jgi:hypothetical protein